MSAENLRRYIELDHKAKRIAEALEQLAEFQLIVGAAITKYYGESPVVFEGVVLTADKERPGLYSVTAVTTVHAEVKVCRLGSLAD